MENVRIKIDKRVVYKLDNETRLIGAHRDIWKPFGPIIVLGPGFICGVSITLTCRDQGWGNRKGHIQLRTTTSEDETKNGRIWISPVAEHSSASTSHFIKADNKEIVSLNADITSMSTLQLQRSIGGGGGHELIITNLEVTVYICESTQRPLTDWLTLQTMGGDTIQLQNWGVTQLRQHAAKDLEQQLDLLPEECYLCDDETDAEFNNGLVFERYRFMQALHAHPLDSIPEQDDDHLTISMKPPLLTLLRRPQVTVRAKVELEGNLVDKDIQLVIEKAAEIAGEYALQKIVRVLYGCDSKEGRHVIEEGGKGRIVMMIQTDEHQQQQSFPLTTPLDETGLKEGSIICLSQSPSHHKLCVIC